MKKIFKLTIYLFFVFVALTSCQTLKDGLEGNKKSKSAEEFLIERPILQALRTENKSIFLVDEIDRSDEEFWHRCHSHQSSIERYFCCLPTDCGSQAW